MPPQDEKKHEGGRNDGGEMEEDRMQFYAFNRFNPKCLVIVAHINIYRSLTSVLLLCVCLCVRVRRNYGITIHPLIDSLLIY